MGKRTGLMVGVCVAISALVAGLQGCSGDRAAEYSRAVVADVPPRDFSVSVTVLSPRTSSGARSIITPGRNGLPGGETIIPASAGLTGASVAGMPIVVRPARYVMEADWILRGAVGATSRETFFPDQTRQLDGAQVERLWKAMRSSGVMAEGHPGLVSRAPTPEELESTERGAPARYIISYSVANVRKTVLVDSPLMTDGVLSEEIEGTPAMVVKTLGDLCWMKEPARPAAPADAGGSGAGETKDPAAGK